MMIFKSIQLFEVGISEGLLQRERPATLRTLASAAFGLHFCFQLVPFINSKLTKAKAPQDELEKLSSAAATRLNAAYGEIVKRIETIPSKTAEPEPDSVSLGASSASKKATDITDLALGHPRLVLM
jgi:hypothetical protein